MNFSSNVSFAPSKEKKSVSSFVKEFFETDVVCVSPDTSLEEVAKAMQENHIGNVLVVDQKNREGIKRPIGIVTDRDIVVKCIGRSGIDKQYKASDIMSSSISTAKETDDLSEMISIMKDNGITRLPIVNEQEELVGIVTAKKLLQLLTKELGDLMMISDKQHQKEADFKH